MLDVFAKNSTFTAAAKGMRISTSKSEAGKVTAAPPARGGDPAPAEEAEVFRGLLCGREGRSRGAHRRMGALHNPTPDKPHKMDRWMDG